MKTKTKIDKQLKRKTNPELVRTIIEAKKKPKWTQIASIMSSPRIRKIQVNLTRLDSEAKEGETIVVPGKVLSEGELHKKIKIIAFGFSEKAREKLLKSKSEVSSIVEEIKKNPDAKGVKLIT